MIKGIITIHKHTLNFIDDHPSCLPPSLLQMSHLLCSHSLSCTSMTLLLLHKSIFISIYAVSLIYKIFSLINEMRMISQKNIPNNPIFCVSIYSWKVLLEYQCASFTLLSAKGHQWTSQRMNLGLEVPCLEIKMKILSCFEETGYENMEKTGKELKARYEVKTKCWG